MPELLKDISVLFEGMEVTNEQLEKFQTNLEAIISEKVSSYKEEISADNDKVIAEKVEEEVSDITEKLDDYLSYVVEEWMEENKLAVDNGIKLEIMESFIEGMKELFVEHYVSIPEGKEDLISAAETKVSELESKLNEAIDKNIELKKEIKEVKVKEIINEATKNLTDTQKEKFASLTEDINSTDLDTFKSKVETIRESFFKPEKSDEVIDDKNANDKNDRMSIYASAL